MQGVSMIAQRLRQLRGHYKVTVEQVSSKSGISIRNLMMYEEGAAVPSQQELQILAQLYRVGMDFFAPTQQHAVQMTQAQAYAQQQAQAQAYAQQQAQAYAQQQAQAIAQQQAYAQQQAQAQAYAQQQAQAIAQQQAYAQQQAIAQQQAQARAAYAQQQTVTRQQVSPVSSIKETKAYQARTTRLKAMRRATFIKLFTLFSILLLAGVGYCYSFVFANLSLSYEHFGQTVYVTTALDGFGFLKQFLNPDFFVRLLSTNLYVFFGIGGLLALNQFFRLVSKSKAFLVISRYLLFLLICCFVISAVCFVKFFEFYSLGFIIHLSGLTICIVVVGFSLLKKLEV